jgi:hypothetical protein
MKPCAVFRGRGATALAGRPLSLLECAAVGNWKQLQARIRKARVGADAPAKLEQLYLKTRDAMVAFELGKVHEQGQREGEAIEWYRKAHERFRREEWRTKAAEAIQRLGGTPPAASELPSTERYREQAPEPAAAAAVPTPREWAALPDRLFHSSESSRSLGVDTQAESQEPAAEVEAGIEPGNIAAPEHEAAPVRPGESRTDGKRRRRGRRGGRRHRRGGPAEHAPGPGVPPAPQEAPAPSAPPRMPAPAPPRTESAEASGWVGARAEELRTRAGDPGLASRVARLEMQVRRLLACPPQKVNDADLAPAGPGVLLLSDSDLTTHYYICACDTLRIEIGRLTRSDRGSRGRGREQHPPLRGRLAEHLEISESQVAKYLETHCVVRWLQLDEGAPRVAHFAISVLEPILNE